MNYHACRKHDIVSYLFDCIVEFSRSNISSIREVYFVGTDAQGLRQGSEHLFTNSTICWNRRSASTSPSLLILTPTGVKLTQTGTSTITANNSISFQKYVHAQGLNQSRFDKKTQGSSSCFHNKLSSIPKSIRSHYLLQELRFRKQGIQHHDHNVYFHSIQ